MCDVGSKETGTHFYNNTITGEELSVDTVSRLLRDLETSYLKKPTIAITSAEPLLYKPLFCIIEKMKIHGFKVQLTTNGYILPKHAQSIIRSNVDDLWISIDGIGEVHDKIRGGNGAYENALSGIKIIDEIKREMGISVPRIHINYTITDLNYDKLIDFMLKFPVDMVEDVWFSHLNFVTDEMVASHTAQCGIGDLITRSSVKNVDLDKIDVYRLWNNISFVRMNFKNVFFVPDIDYNDMVTYYRFPIQSIRNYAQCHAPWRAGQIFSNGNVGVATRCFVGSVGNIKNDKFSEIWNGTKMRNFRNRLLKETGGCFPVCTRCCGLF
jgi:MoaA/NifB/PqqE/SkfB family radical SAM enzyme